MASRTVLKNIISTEKLEGVGAVIRRSIGIRQMRNFTPFVLLDDFSVDPRRAGFPPHPHHGMETITLVNTGSIAHEDFSGGKGILNQGDLQVMTAGVGIMHAEIPVAASKNEKVTGMQLWVDLPEKLKNIKPRYMDIRSHDIPTAKPDDKVEVKVISGSSYGVTSYKNLAYTPVNYYHYLVKPGGHFKQEIPKDFNVFVYIISGKLKINGITYKPKVAIFLNRDGDFIEGENSVESNETTDFIIVGGQVLDQEIIQNGPFVETTKEKMKEAYDDFFAKRKGFQCAKDYKFHLKIGISKDEAAKFVNATISK